MKAVLHIARKELQDGLRNRWVSAISLIFAVLAVGLSYFGAAASGTVGFTSVPTTIVSLASLAVFLIPLIALMLAYDAIVGEDENGTLLLLLTYPLTRGQLLLGKFLGHGAILAVSTLLGFGSAALVIALFAEGIALGQLVSAFAIFIGSAILLGMVFVVLAYLISCLVAEKSKAAGMALITWFLFVLIFDLALLGVLVGTEGQVSEQLLPYLLLLNPTDIFRLINLIGFEAGQAGLGVLSIADGVAFSHGSLALALLAWIVLPLLLAFWIFNKRAL